MIHLQLLLLFVSFFIFFVSNDHGYDKNFVNSKNCLIYQIL